MKENIELQKSNYDPFQNNFRLFMLLMIQKVSGCAASILALLSIIIK